jgi:hypothetical protein
MLRREMEYKVVEAYSDSNDYVAKVIEKLEEKVDGYIKLGWKPIGGASISKLTSSWHAIQAMIKE